MRETWVRREQLMEGVAVIALLLGKRAGVGRTPTPTAPHTPAHQLESDFHPVRLNYS